MEADFAFVSMLQQPAQPLRLDLRNSLNRVETVKPAHSSSGQGPRGAEPPEGLNPPLAGLGSRRQEFRGDVLRSRAPGRGGRMGDAHLHPTGLASTPSVWDAPCTTAGPATPRWGVQEARGCKRLPPGKRCSGGGPGARAPCVGPTMESGGTQRVLQHRIPAAITPHGSSKTAHPKG